jgi:uncharacterized pyridoxal phosphate-containing UPF0001 family protein
MEHALAIEDACARLRSSLAELEERIRAAGRDPRSVRIVAVTKGFGLEQVVAALRVGLVDLGENYATELARKATRLVELDTELDVAGNFPGRGPSGGIDGPRWHFLGRVDTRGARRVAGHVALWQSVTSSREAAVVARVAPGSEVLVQVNVTGMPGRRGCERRETASVVGAAEDAGLVVRGLMAVGPPPGTADAREGFSWLAAQAANLGLEELSMGMSDDLEVALEEGATMLRIGRALFGERPRSCEPG